ncbi:hypothetical protein XENOCAPTIV_005546 [Xenoophorus captivus]|uniref:Uncharacterized protein n=1 Tax=Xenoophorus captivus TaxID=1517983 RepID=A0ABV0SGN3_9TELE
MDTRVWNLTGLQTRPVHPTWVSDPTNILLEKWSIYLRPCGHSFLFYLYSSSSTYPGQGCGGSRLSREAQTSLSPDTSSHPSRGTPRHPLASRETKSLQCVLGLLLVGCAANTSQGRHPGGIGDRCLSHLNWLLWMWRKRLYSEILSDGRAAHPTSKGVPGNPAEEAHFSCEYLGSRSFSHDSKFMPIGEGRNVD